MKIEELPLRFDGIEESPYAGFWRRFGAFWLDALIMLPWTLLITYINNEGRLNTLYTLVPSYIFFFFYSIYTVKRWGGTPGKLITKIIIVRKDGKKAEWKEAILRHAVQFIIGIPVSIAFILVLLKMTDQEYTEMDFMARSAFIMASMPIWYKPINWINQIWIWGEFIILLLNKRKRALHDFVAGTVVIKQKFKDTAEQVAAGQRR